MSKNAMASLNMLLFQPIKAFIENSFTTNQASSLFSVQVNQGIEYFFQRIREFYFLFIQSRHSNFVSANHGISNFSANQDILNFFGKF